MTCNKMFYSISIQLGHISFLAAQAKSINLYKNLRTKLMKCCANIYFNKLCLAKKVIPNYATIKPRN